MTTKKQVLLVCGTRPEIIKMAPVYEALRASQTLEPIVLHTGQHTDLATPLYEFFAMPPDETIDLKREDPSLSALFAALLSATSKVIAQRKPHAVLVHGDTSSSVAAALAAFNEQTPVGHVEAGLRTLDRYSPFPEEMNRSLTARLATWHYAPTEQAVQALVREGVPPQDVLMTGNTVIDAAQRTVARLQGGPANPFVAAHNLHNRLQGRRLVLVTAHRRENWGTGLEQIAQAVAQLLQDEPDLFFVWPLHANPAVAQAVRAELANHDFDATRLVLTPPLEYPTLIWLLENAWVTLTDSGGIQEEAAALGTPVLILRESTERPELLVAGGGALTGAHRADIVRWMNRLAQNPGVHQSMCNIVNPFGDGTASAQIRAHLERVL